MLYVIGTTSETKTLERKLPSPVFESLLQDIQILDSEYGANRNYLEEDGGYSIILETSENLAALKEHVNYEAFPCEWATVIKGSPDYVSALYLLNNDFVIIVYMPHSIVPDSILKELEVAAS